jgi:ribosomal protein S18 acetylase RimI-like enzyme
LRDELLYSATELLAAAFSSNPAHVYICPNSDTRYEQLKWLLGGNLRAQSDLGLSFCVATGKVVSAMGFWTDSESPRTGLIRQVRAGLLLAPIRLGPAGVRRLLEVTSSVEAQLDSTLCGRPHWTLNNMAVDEELRGQGIGTDLLRSEIRKLSLLQPTWPIALCTQRERNVLFYRRAGFEIGLSAYIGKGPQRFQNWTMVREPDAE